MSLQNNKSVIVIGTGIAGIATAYYLAKNHGQTRITLVDRDQPMAFTSAQSGENYRNWWPHPTMVAFTDRSIDLMEEVARASGNRINMNRRGYALATREANIDPLIEQLHGGLGERASSLLRYHDTATAPGYAPFDKPDWEDVPDGVDIVTNQDLIRARFPSYDPEVRAVIHVRRGGDISGQQLGMYMLDYLKSVGARRVVGEVTSVEAGAGFRVGLSTRDGPQMLQSDQIVNAAGPFADKIAAMLGVELPVHNTFQQKIAFEDRKGAIPRALPFSIDLDGQQINWSDEERAMLLEYPEFAWLAQDMPGAIHCRPDGGDGGKWVKLGWAYNETPATATWEPQLDENFPDIVLRGASRLNPALKAYFGQLPRNMHHYGGWYTMTEENWPLIGRMGPEGAFMNCALSGFGTMAACAAGELCAATMVGADLPDYAAELSLSRYDDANLIAELQSANRGVL
ncbi:MAG: FAD-dependent oxidoreductase [Rhodobacterales bacterium]|nr:MAG: FAD-dependent oxidoreductase [Rhodobacterales bacterium]